MLTFFWLVQMVPHLGADEEILTLDLAVLFLQKVPDGIANLTFVLVEPGTVEMARFDILSAQILPLLAPT